MIIQSPISIRESMKRLLVSHNTNIFFSNGGINRFLARQSTFSVRSLPIPKINTFNGEKYLRNTFKYLERPIIMESLSNEVFVN